jgi:hypothetical protein
MHSTKPNALADFFPRKRLILEYQKVPCGHNFKGEKMFISQMDVLLPLEKFLVLHDRVGKSYIPATQNPAPASYA